MTASTEPHAFEDTITPMASSMNVLLHAALSEGMNAKHSTKQKMYKARWQIAPAASALPPEPWPSNTTAPIEVLFHVCSHGLKLSRLAPQQHQLSYRTLYKCAPQRAHAAAAASHAPD
eukprot:1193916-Amphidinium_carterae.1